MKNTRTVKILVLMAVLFGLTSVLFWNLRGGATPANAIVEERQNQERIRQDLPRPNESAPGRAGAANTPS